MTAGATPTSVDELDELVPPPGPWWRRAAVWLLFLSVLVGVGWTWSSGTATPRLHNQGWGYGGTGPVDFSVVITNDSRVAVEIVGGPRDRAGVELLGAQVQVGSEGDAAFVADPFPVRLEPGEELSLTAWYAVTDCDVIAADTEVPESIDVQARIAEGPFGGIVRTRWLETPTADDQSWVARMAGYACG